MKFQFATRANLMNARSAFMFARSDYTMDEAALTVEFDRPAAGNLIEVLARDYGAVEVVEQSAPTDNDELLAVTADEFPLAFSHIVRESEKALLVAVRKGPPLSKVRRLLLTDEAAVAEESANAQTTEMWIPRSCVTVIHADAHILRVARWWGMKNGFAEQIVRGQVAQAPGWVA